MKFCKKMPTASRRLLVLTEGGREFGFGHVVRCKTIADSLAKYGFVAYFVIDGDDSLWSFLSGVDGCLFDWKKDKNALAEKLSFCDAVLMDSIDADDALFLFVENFKKPFAVIDDFKRRNILKSGIVIDWTVGVENTALHKIDVAGVRFLLGAKYTPLRKEFVNIGRNPIRKSVETVMVSFGGSDIHKMSVSILKLLSSKYPYLQKNVVLGNGFGAMDDIRAVADANTHLLTGLNAAQMASCMYESDFAIAAGGMSLYELAKIGTPTIAVLMVENAKEDTLGWRDVGFVAYVGEYNLPDLFESLECEIDKMLDYETRLKSSNCTGWFSDFDGSDLLSLELSEELL